MKKTPYTRLCAPLVAAACLTALAHSSHAANSGHLEIIPDADMRIRKAGNDKAEDQTTVSNNLGKTDLMGVYKDLDRSLLLFNLSEIPQGAKITKAILQLTAKPVAITSNYTPPNAANVEMGVYRLTKPWDEMSANWLEAAAGTPWENLGGDAVGETGECLADPYSVNNDSGEQFNDQPPKLDWDVTNLVNEWVSGKFPNHGLMIRTAQPSNRLHFCTKEFPTDGYQPVLKIDWAK